ncbi:hypothetical protein [Candidatus Hodgkinia cicadicola]|uniref:hypothetical protein n=1 Tax=Candidatus Hodgkinia cicadicola TaxID=573658 RepID=UPI001788C813
MYIWLLEFDRTLADSQSKVVLVLLMATCSKATKMLELSGRGWSESRMAWAFSIAWETGDCVKPRFRLVKYLICSFNNRDSNQTLRFGWVSIGKETSVLVLYELVWSSSETGGWFIIWIVNVVL